MQIGENPSPEEQSILDQVYKETGVSARYLQSIAANEPEVVSKVLPILIEALDRIESEYTRISILTLFRSKAARVYVPRLLSSLSKAESQEYRLRVLETLADLVARENAALIWRSVRSYWQTSLWGLLAVRLARFSSVKGDVCEFVYQHLDQLPKPELYSVARLPDPRIKEWFSDQLDSEDPLLASIAEKVLGRYNKLPKALKQTPSGPGNGVEITSIEFDLQDLPNTLREISRNHGIQLPAGIDDPHRYGGLAIDQWVAASVKVGDGSRADLWLRKEDEDVVELWLTQAE